MNKKNILSLILLQALLLAQLLVNCQSISSSVIPSGGLYIKNAYASISSTIGEPISSSFSNNHGNISHGFQQGYTNRRLLVKAFLEGLYNGTTMNKVQDGSGGSVFPGEITDSVRLSLYRAVPPFDRILARYHVPLQTDGTMDIILSNIPAGSYFISIVHRNSIEVWSASPVTLNSGLTSYDFTTSVSMAYGNNLKDMNGVCALYTGDICSAGNIYPNLPEQDGVIDTDDVYYMMNSYNNGDSGNLASDLNGDGVVDLMDIFLGYDNYMIGIYKMTP